MNRRHFVQAGVTAMLVNHLPIALSADPPASPFGASSTAEEVTAGLDLTGKTALVTGCNSGIGYETMRVLALRGAHVIGTGRTLERARDACGSVEGRATPAVLELSDFESVAACAESVLAMDTPIDMLICNAGMLLRDLRQVNGLEMQFVVNHLGHFLIVNRLLDQVLAAPQGRVVVVSSIAHGNAPEGGIQFDNLSGEGWAREAYGHSKLANGLFSLELASRLEDTAATSNSLHPGVIRETNITRYLPAAMGSVQSMPGKTISQGAATTCYVATYPELADVSGLYFDDCDAVAPGGYMEDREMARRLWAVSEELTGDHLG